MSTTITGKLNKAANEFQAGESIGFGLRIGVQHYDRKAKQKDWTNYSCVIFAKASAQIDFLRQNLQMGAIVEVTATHERIDAYQGSNGDVLSIELINAQMGYIHSTGDQPPQQQQAPQQQRAPQQNQQQQYAPQQQPAAPQAAPGGFDDEPYPF